MNQLIEKAKKIRCIISDVDGVLTNGLLYIDNNGNEQKAFHVQDGMGLKLLMSAGIEVAIITTANNGVITERMKQLGIKHVFTGQVSKLAAYAELKIRLNIDDNAFCYVGDDLPDLPIIQQVGLGVAVANAVPQVREFASYITSLSGGNGAVREVCDILLNAQDLLEKALQGYYAS